MNYWQTVQGIAPGSSISVTVFKHRGRRECELLRVSESDLACELERGHFSKRLVFLRDDIREVRLERPDNHHMIAGAVIGGAAGLAIGVLASARSVDPESRSADPAFGALLGFTNVPQPGNQLLTQPALDFPGDESGGIHTPHMDAVLVAVGAQFRPH